jgi:hypothetical protein
MMESGVAATTRSRWKRATPRATARQRIERITRWLICGVPFPGGQTVQEGESASKLVSG